MKDVVIIGAGGHAREILDVIDAVNTEAPIVNMIGYIVDPQYGRTGTVVNDRPILGGFDWLENHLNTSVICGVGAPNLRKYLVERVQVIGNKFFTIIHPSAKLTKWIQLGEGVVITAGSILTNNIYIGNHVHINIDCTVSHDTIINEFTTLSPGVHICGSVHIQNGCFIGAGVTVIDKISVGAWSIIGAGASIVSDVPANSTVVGVPGKVIKTRIEGWHII